MKENEINSINNLIKTEALIEQHLHGGFGIDFSVCSAKDFITFSQEILKFGVCGYFPTLATDTIENLKRQIQEIKKACKMQNNSTEPMAMILGVHIEACFLNPLKKGIHDKSLLLKPSIENFKQLEDEIIKIVTLAPELDVNQELCKYLKSKNIRVSAGHTIATNLEAVDQVTHLYNAMGSFTHKEKSTVTSALTNDDISVELIADLKHVEEDVLKITFKTKSPKQIILISDALPITHSENKQMTFCNKEIFMKNGKAVDETGTMAGSTMFVSEIIKQLVNNNLLDFQTAIKMATENINYINKPCAEIYWDKELNISKIIINNKTIEFK